MLVAGLGLASSCALVIGVDGDFVEGDIGGGGSGTTFTTSTSTGGTTTTTLFGGGTTTSTTALGGGGATSSGGTGGSAGAAGAGGDGLLANGAPCTIGTECRSALCVDDVCCDNACIGPCQSCLADDTEQADGVCAPVSLGFDPTGDCVAPEYCDGAGSCTEIGLECPLGTECTAHSCVDGVCCDAACDGACVACDGILTGEPAGICAPLPVGQSDPDHCQPAEICGPAGCVDCAASLPPTGGTCPGTCTGGCANDVCLIQCDGNSECAAAQLACPAGFACRLVCSGATSCEDATLQCPDDHACEVECSCAGPPNGCCSGLAVTCGTGTCNMTCSDANNACSGATLACGLRDCAATCQGATAPTVSCPATAVCGCDAC
jgi:hypothetical protein